VQANGDVDLLAEARLLRQHKGRLEARMRVLEEHNEQLDSQLKRLRQLLHDCEQASPLHLSLSAVIMPPTVGKGAISVAFVRPSVCPSRT